MGEVIIRRDQKIYKIHSLLFPMVWEKKKKSGSVYFLKSTRNDGSTKTYTGSTTRSVNERFKEHSASVGKSKSWIGRGTSVSKIGSFPSKNPRKAEATVKRNRKKKYGY